MNDKRKHKRHKTRDLLVVLDRETAQPIAGLANLSTEGAMFVSQTQVELGHLFKCQLELPQPILDRTKIEFDAVCRWSKKSDSQNSYESGYVLINVSDTVKEIISYLILRCVIDEWSHSNCETVSHANELESVDQGGGGR